MSSNHPDQSLAPLPLVEPRVHGSAQSHAGKDTQAEPETAQHGASTSDPFPTLDSQPPFQYHASLHPIDTASAQVNPTVVSPHAATPLSAGLRLQTDHLAEITRKVQEEPRDQAPLTETPAQQTVFNAGLPVRTSSIRSIYGSRPHRTSSLSPGSAVSSPGMGPLVDMTPLPSPISLWGSPKLWRSSTIDNELGDSAELDIGGEPSEPQFTPFARIPSKKRKIPLIGRGATGQEAQMYNSSAAARAQQRSFSDYSPDGVQIPKLRNIAVSISGDPSQSISPPDDHMHREEYLGVQRGLIAPKPPTPPDSNRGVDSGDQGSPSPSIRPAEVGPAIIYEARTLRRGQVKRWKALRELGKGSFSTVMLAIRDNRNIHMPGDAQLDEAEIDLKSLVAVKICEHGPAGGADEQKVQNSIKREVELMKSIDHPSLVHLKAVSMLDRQTIMVETYCAGGDLYELADTKFEILTPPFIRRIFAELVAAVQYLHLQDIVHRDIKLESRLWHSVSRLSWLLKWVNRCPCKSAKRGIQQCNRLANIPFAGSHTNRSWSRTMDPETTVVANAYNSMRK